MTAATGRPCSVGLFSGQHPPVEMSPVSSVQWLCVQMPGSAETFGTGKAVRVEGTVNGLGDVVDVHLSACTA